MPESIRIEIYSRPGCHLCDEAKAVIEPFSERYPLELTVTNVDSDAESPGVVRHGNPGHSDQWNRSVSASRGSRSVRKEAQGNCGTRRYPDNRCAPRRRGADVRGHTAPNDSSGLLRRHSRPHAGRNGNPRHAGAPRERGGGCRNGDRRAMA